MNKINATRWSGIVDYLRQDDYGITSKDLKKGRKHYVSDSDKSPNWEKYPYYLFMELLTSTDSFDETTNRVIEILKEEDQKKIWDFVKYMLSMQANPKIYCHQNTYFHGREEELYLKIRSLITEHPGYFLDRNRTIYRMPTSIFFKNFIMQKSIGMLTKSTVSRYSQTWRHTDMIQSPFKVAEFSYIPPDERQVNTICPIEFAHRLPASDHIGIQNLKTIHDWIINSDPSTRIAEFYNEVIDSHFDAFDNESGAGQMGHCVLTFNDASHAEACIRLLRSSTRPPLPDEDSEDTYRYYRINSSWNRFDSEFGQPGTLHSTAGVVLCQLWDEGLEAVDIEMIDTASVSFRFEIPVSGLYEDSRLERALNSLCYEMTQLDDVLRSRLLMPQDVWSNYDSSRIANCAYYVPFKDGRWRIGFLNRCGLKPITEGENAELDKLVSQSENTVAALHKITSAEFEKFHKNYSSVIKDDEEKINSNLTYSCLHKRNTRFY